MTAAYRHCLAVLQLRCRHAEHHAAPEQGQPCRLHLLVAPSATGRHTSIGIQVQRQRSVAPLVGKQVFLGGVKVVDTRYHVPFAAQHLAVTVLHLIGIDDVRQRMLAAHQCRCLQRPHLAVLGMHQQVLAAHRTVLAMKRQRHMQALAPCRIIMYGKLQLHLFVTTFLQKYEKVCIPPLFVASFFFFLPKAPSTGRTGNHSDHYIS